MTFRVAATPLDKKVQSMQVFIAGSGKLASELLEHLVSSTEFTVSAWTDEPEVADRCIVVHAGSGRQLDGIAKFCRQTSSALVELSTGSSLEGSNPAFPVVLCPNTNILMLKFMCMLERSGGFYKGLDVSLTESHQAGKTSVPGTAVVMAQAIGLAPTQIESVRPPDQQVNKLGIPPDQLSRHAFHRIEIKDGSCSVTLETRVYGNAPYASGVQKILAAVCRRVLSGELQPRIYAITELIESGWL